MWCGVGKRREKMLDSDLRQSKPFHFKLYNDELTSSLYLEEKQPKETPVYV